MSHYSIFYYIGHAYDIPKATCPWIIDLAKLYLQRAGWCDDKTLNLYLEGTHFEV